MFPEATSNDPRVDHHIKRASVFMRNATRPSWTLLTFCVTLAGTLAGPASSVWAGLSSENVIVVVNADSTVSRTLANHYIDARKIPTRNVIHLNGVPTGIKIELDLFREKILKPLLAEIDARGIASRARVIAYSADFPTAVRIKKHHALVTEPTTKKYQLPVASINGLTYFYRYVLSDNPGYLSFASNLYARGRFERHFLNPFQGEQKTKFDEATSLVQEESFAESAAIWKELFETNQAMPALAIRAAESYSKANDETAAIEMLQEGIRHGWWSATYLKETPSLEKLLSEPTIARTIEFLDDAPMNTQGPVAFPSGVGWTLSGSFNRVADGGVPYLMACSLGVVNSRGSTLPQAIRVLQRSSQSDRTFPQGRFTFGGNPNVRARTRFPSVPPAIAYLKAAGFESSIYEGSCPTKKGNILGMMTGHNRVPLQSKPWRFVPGAIAENLTSYGGVFDSDGQTKLTEFLHFGAAMSSGAVVEPYSLQPKFPEAMLYGFYAKGMSAIESFYLSVKSPYQLLIVGDPLAQPFARAPAEIMKITLLDDEKKRIRFTRQTLGFKAPKSRTRTVEISIDDRAFKTTPPVPNVDINWPTDVSGVFDFRATLAGLDRTEPRITFLSSLDVQGPKPAPVATRLKPSTDGATDLEKTTTKSILETKATWSLSCPGADEIALMHMGAEVAKIEGAEGSVTFETKPLGGGPLRFRPVARFGDEKVRGFEVID